MSIDLDDVERRLEYERRYGYPSVSTNEIKELIALARKGQRYDTEIAALRRELTDFCNQHPTEAEERAEVYERALRAIVRDDSGYAHPYIRKIAREALEKGANDQRG